MAEPVIAGIGLRVRRSIGFLRTAPAGSVYLAYGVALGLGILFVLREFPLSVALGHTPDAMLFGDTAQNAIGQRYFIADTWRWPLLTTRLLQPPQGVNIALTDSIPLAALLAKLSRAVLPAGFIPLFPWLALCYVAQPMAAVFALRGIGEIRLLPAVCIAIMAICCPTLLFRAGHIALCSHFLILLALGVHFRSVRSGSATRAPILLLPASLLIHPYLLVMVAAVLAAAPLSFLARRQGVWRPAALWLVSGLLLTAGLAVLLNYGATPPDGGFGQASMNLLSPFDPAYSGLLQDRLPGLDAPVDATGSQYDGYQYLGLGLILLTAAAGLTARRRRFHFAARQDLGLWAVCLCLTLFALSDVVYAGHVKLLDLGLHWKMLNQFRASGRFFWPVTYVLLIGSVARLCARLPYRAAAALLLIATTLQYQDTSLLRHAVAAHTHDDAPLSLDGPNPRLLLMAFMRGLPLPGAHPETARAIDETRLHALLALHDQLTIWPTAACGLPVASTPAFLPLVLAASDTLMPVNTASVARDQTEPDCDALQIAGQPLGEGELRVFMPSDAALAPFIVPDGAADCRALGRLAVCTRRRDAMLDLPPVGGAPPIAAGVKIDAGSPAARPLLAFGWSPEPDGAWSLGHDAAAVGHLDTPAGTAMRFTCWAHGFTGVPGLPQKVTLSIGGHVLAAWQVAVDRDEVYQALVPADLLPGGNLSLRFRITTPRRPADLGVNGDRRDLGLFVRALRLDAVGAVPGPGMPLQSGSSPGMPATPRAHD